MLNEELFDSKDLEIAKLKYAIKKFKEYDKERKEHYASLEQEVGALKAYIQELEENKDYEKLNTKIKNQREVIRTLETKLHFASLEIPRIQELEIVSRNQLKEQIEDLRKNYKSKKLECEQAWSLIAKYRNKFGEL